MDANPAVVVGTDGTDSALRAVDWAAREALVRAVALRIVHVLPEAARLDGAQHATNLLARAYTVAHRHVPHATVGTELRIGDAATELADAASDAALLVVGTLDNRAGELVLGSVVMAIAGAATCPVTVVRGEIRRSTAPVVVGVRDVEADAAAIGLAFADAHRHGSGLVAVHARHASPEERAAAAAALLIDLAPWRDRRPDVEVEVSVVSGAPADQLLLAARTARLIVVGRRGRGILTRAMLGSTSRAVMRYSRCPVTVVRRGPAAATSTASADAGRLDPHDRAELW